MVGAHSEAIKINYPDYERAVKPEVADLAIDDRDGWRVWYLRNEEPGGSQSVAPRLTRRFCEEWLDDLFQVGALAFRARQLLRFVFLDGHDLVKFMMAAATDVFVKRHDAE